MVLAIRLFEFRSGKDICSMYAKLLRCTVYACEAALAMGKPQDDRGNPKNQPISELDIFSKRQALSRAVVVNSNMSRGKYLAREGPGSRLTARDSESRTVDLAARTRCVKMTSSIGSTLQPWTAVSALWAIISRVLSVIQWRVNL